MKRTIDEHAARFDAKADEYDDRDPPVYRACADLVIEYAAPGPDDVVLDLGTGTGAIALPLAERAAQVVGRDISTSMLSQARAKVRESAIDNVSVDTGSFREPAYGGPADIVTSNYAMHHLDDTAKGDAIEDIADYRPERFVLGDVMLFEESDPAEPEYDKDVDDPATVGVLAHAFTTAGFEITDITRVTAQAGVIVGEAPREGWGS